MSKVIYMRPLLDTSAYRNWYKNFQQLWDNPYWFYVAKEQVVDSKTFCTGHSANNCPNPYSCNAPSTLESVAGTTQPMPQVQLNKFTFEYRGPSALVTHTLHAGSCPLCSNVYWTPERVDTFPWTAEVLSTLAKDQTDLSEFNALTTRS